MSTLTAHLDVPFSESLSLDLYVPDSEVFPGSRPLIVWVHGGGFMPGNDKSQSYVVALSVEFSRRGYVCASPDYRLRVDALDDIRGAVADASADVESALRWIREHADAYWIDPERVFLGGGSAGGMTVVTLCYTSSQNLLGLINLWGSPPPEMTEGYSIPQKTPYFSVHGTADELVPYANGTALLEFLRRHGVEADLFSIADAPHTPMAYQEQIVERVQAFLDRYAGRYSASSRERHWS